MTDESQTIEAYINSEKSEDFYKEGFAKYSVLGVDQFQWNWSWWAMFGGIFYLLYRKLYLESLIYFFIFIIAGYIPIFILLLWIVGGGVLPYFVYKKYKKMKAQVEQNLASTQEQLDALRIVGGVNRWALWVGVPLSAFFWYKILSMLAVVIIMLMLSH